MLLEKERRRGEREEERREKERGTIGGILEGSEEECKRGYYEVYLRIIKYILRSEKLSR